MKTTAAVAFQAGKPLEIVTLDLEGPKAWFWRLAPA
jgi:Zn-dependent alcohol dehydrogenase